CAGCCKQAGPATCAGSVDEWVAWTRFRWGNSRFVFIQFNHCWAKNEKKIAPGRQGDQMPSNGERIRGRTGNVGRTESGQVSFLGAGITRADWKEALPCWKSSNVIPNWPS